MVHVQNCSDLCAHYIIFIRKRKCAGYVFPECRHAKKEPLQSLILQEFFVRCHPDSNWRIKVLQTFALPLGYGALKNGAVDEARTRDLHLGKVALYQLSYYRLFEGALGRS